VAVTEAEGKYIYRVAWKHANGSVTMEAPKPYIERGSPWFIYPESADSVWVYNGADQFFHITRGPGGLTMFDAKVAQAPPAVAGRLPEDFKQRQRAKGQ